jgi:hypothetical protein
VITGEALDVPLNVPVYAFSVVEGESEQAPITKKGRRYLRRKLTGRLRI